MPQNDVSMLEHIIALLKEHPEWQDALREVLFPEWKLFNDLTRQIHALVESQQQTDAIVRALAERQDRFEERMEQVEAQIAALVEAQRKTEAMIQALVERQDRLDEHMVQVIERQDRFEERMEQVEAQIAALVEAQRKTEAMIQALVERQDRLEERVVQVMERQDRLEQAMVRMMERQDRLEQAMVQVIERQDRLEERQDRTEERLDTVERQLAELTTTVRHLVNAQHQMNATMGKMLGWYQEARFRERAPSYLGTIGFSKVRLIPREKWVDYMQEAFQKGQITKDEWRDVLDVDVVVQAQRDGKPIYLVIEVSHTVDERDVERAVRRADIWQRLVSEPSSVVPLVAGEQITEAAMRAARSADVVVVLDGRESS